MGVIKYDWETVYHTQTVDDGLLGDRDYLEKFKRTKQCKTIYYQTYGGGPEGGYFVRMTLLPTEDFQVKYEVYRVNRDWGTPFSIEYLPEMMVETRYNDEQMEARLYKD
jgi:hypothetical protein